MTSSASRYDILAAKRGGLPCHLVSLDEETADVPAGWGHHLLPDLLAGWRDSSSEGQQAGSTRRSRIHHDAPATFGSWGMFLPARTGTC